MKAKLAPAQEIDGAAPSTRSRILHAAYACFGEIGLFGTTMEDVARKAGLARRTVYAHFPRRHVLFEEIVEEETRAVNLWIRERIDRSAEFEDLLAQAVALGIRAVAESRRGWLESDELYLSSLGAQPNSSVHHLQKAKWNPMIGRGMGMGRIAGDVGLDETVSWLVLTNQLLVGDIRVNDTPDAELLSLARQLIVEQLLPGHETAYDDAPLAPLVRYSAGASCGGTAPAGPEERILHAAAGSFEALGPQRTVMSDIALAAGYSRKTVYQYFANKDEIVGRLALLRYQRLHAWIGGYRPAALPFRERLVAELVAFAGLMQDCPELALRIADATYAAPYGIERATMRALIEQHWSEAVGDAIATGQVAAGLDDGRILHWIELAHVALAIRLKADPLPERKLVRFIDRFLVEPLRPRRDTRRAGGEALAEWPGENT